MYCTQAMPLQYPKYIGGDLMTNDAPRMGKEFDWKSLSPDYNFQEVGDSEVNRNVQYT